MNNETVEKAASGMLEFVLKVIFVVIFNVIVRIALRVLSPFIHRVAEQIRDSINRRKKYI